jgi:hypothetical protein
VRAWADDFVRHLKQRLSAAAGAKAPEGASGSSDTHGTALRCAASPADYSSDQSWRNRPRPPLWSAAL